jgi:hypothetical protein
VPVAATPGVTSARLTTKAFVDAVVAGDFTTAWNMLGPSAKEGFGTAGQFAADRRAFMNMAGNTVVIGEPTQAPDQLSVWLDASLREQMAAESAFVVHLDYPVITNNAGWEVLVVAPDLAGDWRIWFAR